MPQLLASVLGELGISQYLSAFLDQGFDTWDTILDITESDFDALGVKLGHRRKLQRRIANARGVASDASLISPTQPSGEENRSQDQQRADAPRLETRDLGIVVVAKRKYRRHPKPDENAPERPPSAYVLFSNKMREELKGRNLSFTEIAKLVGENWQNLTTAEKEPFESQAQSIKERYLADLAEYKKTADYKKYMAYLQEFKAKHSSPSQDKDGSKRLKMSEPGSQRRSSPNTTTNRSSRSGSRTESRRGSEPPVNRQQRMGSTVSMTTSHASQDEAIHSPIAPSIEHMSSDRSPIFNSHPQELRPMPSQQRSPTWGDDRPEQPPVHAPLPSLSDVLDGQTFGGGIHPGNEVNSYHRFQRDPMPSPGSLSNHHLGGDNRAPPHIKTDPSYGSPRTPLEGQMPIHSLLSSKPEPNSPYSAEQKPIINHQPSNSVGSLPSINGYHTRPSLSHPAVGSNPMSSNYGAPHPPSGPRYTHQAKPDPRLDGMSALLKAGEIVDRRTQ
ncbi:hypothetical protein QBC38DRAFT_356957 [Podospora fimiseda]|uniref:HMG box domain-containing protein n=1 Tax=Podospora fimiseda TaxID=252190 RepID=A0AAN7H2V5_9PEZI|nr:hypothetical protein QBC38DRAFT_356957 [Podospora fimiseda]